LTLQQIEVPTSPAFLLDKNKIISSARILKKLQDQCQCKVLYSIKSLPLTTVLQWLKPHVDGFSVSSLFEARLANEILGESGSLHLTSPGINIDEFQELSQLCQYISFNSTQQFSRLVQHSFAGCSLGLRINPDLSTLDDDRYDPCRVSSKLGVHIEQLANLPARNKIEGLHFHTSFGSRSFEPLKKVVGLFREQLNDDLHAIKWLNLGGGYLFDEMDDYQEFVTLVKQLKQDFQLQVFIEPGKAIVGQAGYLLATVIDLFISNGKKIVVLDTSVNHNPEVFEYQTQPELINNNIDGDYVYELVGSTCLAGDIFGEYRFKQPLLTGDRVIFKNVGAYSLVKASRFNGYNLPDIYALNGNQATLLKHYSYQDFKNYWLG
jgi:carboxynorspermidine decarboxylase